MINHDNFLAKLKKRESNLIKSQYETFIDILVSEREKLGLTQEALAEKLSIAPVTLHQLETKRRRPSFTIYCHIMNALGYNPVPEKKS